MTSPDQNSYHPLLLSRARSSAWGLLFGLLVLFAGACSTPTKVTCQNLDWFEIGRQDGIRGLPPHRLESHQKSCNHPLDRQLVTHYVHGRNSGIAEYCSEENAWELGRSGQEYRNVCPQSLEPAFLRRYRAGRKLFNLEQKSSALSLEIDQISNRLRLEPLPALEIQQLNLRLATLRGSQQALALRMSRLKRRERFSN